MLCVVSEHKKLTCLIFVFSSSFSFFAGLKVNEARASINGLKIKIEKLRVERANLGGEGKGGEEEEVNEYDTLEGQLQNDVHKYKVQYKQNFSELRGTSCLQFCSLLILLLLNRICLCSLFGKIFTIYYS